MRIGGGIVLQDIGTGIVVYRASRLEALLDPLVALLDSSPPDAVLVPQTIIAAHPGMKQWLLRALARRRGPGGIAANLDIVLPSTWLDRLAQEVLGQNAVALRAYQRDFLRWRIHELLADPGLKLHLYGKTQARPGRKMGHITRLTPKSEHRNGDDRRY